MTRATSWPEVSEHRASRQVAELRSDARFCADSATPTCRSARHRRVEPFRELGQVAYDVIWRTALVRPHARGAVDPDGGHSSVLRAADIGLGIVADVDDVLAPDPARIEQMAEHARIGLQCARGASQ